MLSILYNGVRGPGKGKKGLLSIGRAGPGLAAWRDPDLYSDHDHRSGDRAKRGKESAVDERVSDAIALLERTPRILDALLRDLPGEMSGPGVPGEAWRPFDVVGHLIHGEDTDWLPRARIILAHGPNRPFTPFDRQAQFAEFAGQTMPDLLDQFAQRRQANLQALARLDLGAADLARPGMHPELGPVTLGELIATWVVHDLDHLAQIVADLAGRYGDQVGAWRAYLGILDRPAGTG